MSADFRLDDRVALITGASSGIGRQQAQALAEAGARVVLMGRRLDALQQVCDDITASGGQAKALAADLSDLTQVADVAQQATAAFGDVHILCNTAGVNLRQAPEDITIESWTTTLNLNLAVPFFLARELVPTMRTAGYGRIINVASLQTVRAFKNGMAYGASKGGIGQLTRAMAEAWSSDGIVCNAIAPGFFPTELTAPVFANDDAAEQLANQTAIGRNGVLDDLDGATVFFASPASAYITGQILFVDGGFTAR